MHKELFLESLNTIYYRGNRSDVLYAGAVTGGVLRKKVFLKILQISQENTCVGVSSNKVAGLWPIRESNTDIFL